MTPSGELARLFALQRAAFAKERYPDYPVRRDRLLRLLRVVTDDEAALCAAVARDFGHRSAQETRLAELYIVAAGARHMLRHLQAWMRPQRVATPIQLLPGTSRILRQPKGVAGIISPWNYPVQLALAPALGALAAGNRVMLKPSELTPATSALLAERIARVFREDEFAVVNGDADVGAAFAEAAVRSPVLHRVDGGRATRRAAAAANLTPVTLELGGKSPALVDTDADLASVAPRLAVGKLLNAGQTCIAPDYVLVPDATLERFIEAVRSARRAAVSVVSTTTPTTRRSSTHDIMPGSPDCSTTRARRARGSCRSGRRTSFPSRAAASSSRRSSSALRPT